MAGQNILLIVNIGGLPYDITNLTRLPYLQAFAPPAGPHCRNPNRTIISDKSILNLLFNEQKLYC